MNKPIGVLDSGVGGLSVLVEMYKLMPNQDYIYFGDTKNVPYGTKRPEEIYNYTKAILDFFVKNNVKNVVFACNTTSAVAYEKLKADFEGKLRIFPLIQTVAKSIQENLKNNDTVAILATKATINSKKYETEIKKYNNNLNIIGIDCTGFVEIVENRLYNEKSSIELIKSKLQIAKNAKRIVLGCTHYPYLVNIFKDIVDTEYYNPAICLAEIVKKEIYNPQKDKGKISFHVSKDPETFRQSAKLFFDIQQEINLTELK